MGWTSEPVIGELVGYVVGVLLLVLGLVVSIALHELGHMLPAKRFGVRVSRYMVGFGPTLWSRTRGETEYGLKAIPLGGYVRLVGMVPPAEAVGAQPGRGRISALVQAARDASAEEIAPGEDHRAFYRLSTPKKIVVMMGGTFTNLLIAVVLITVAALTVGLPGSTTVDVVSQCVLPYDAPADTECGPGDPLAPAAAAGLQPGDRLLSYGGRPIETWEQFQAAVREVDGERVPVVVRRDGAEVTLQVAPVVTERPVFDENSEPVTGADGEIVTEPVRFVGLSPTLLQRRPLTAVPGAVGDMVWETAKIIGTLPVQLWNVGQAVFGGQERDATGLISIWGAGQVAGEIAAADDATATTSEQVFYMLSLLASVNIALFVFNLIPLLPLDGGHGAGALWEGGKRQVARLRGRPRPAPADMARMMPLAYGVFVLLIGMGLLLVYADIVDPII